MSNLQKKNVKLQTLCSNSLIKSANVIKLYEVTNYLHAASDILTREAVLWDLTLVNLLWSGGVGFICFTEGMQVRVIREGFYHLAGDGKSINKQIPRAQQLPLVLFLPPSFSSFLFLFTFSLSLPTRSLLRVFVTHYARSPIIKNQGHETAPRSLCSSRKIDSSSVWPHLLAAAHNDSADISTPSLRIQLAKWQTELG